MNYVQYKENFFIEVNTFLNVSAHRVLFLLYGLQNIVIHTIINEYFKSIFFKRTASLFVGRSMTYFVGISCRLWIGIGCWNEVNS